MPYEISADVESVRELLRRADALATSQHAMVAQAAMRVHVILMELLIEVDGDEVLGPWQKVI